jgi:hypothetical protein
MKEERRSTDQHSRTLSNPFFDLVVLWPIGARKRKQRRIFVKPKRGKNSSSVQHIKIQCGLSFYLLGAYTNKADISRHRHSMPRFSSGERVTSGQAIKTQCQFLLASVNVSLAKRDSAKQKNLC